MSRNLKLDESCISNPKFEIVNWTRPHHNPAKSNLNFRISDLRCRIRPISKLMLLAVFAVAPTAVLAQQNNASQLQEQQVEVQREAPQPNTDAAQKQPKETQAETQRGKDGKLISVPGGKALGMSILGNQEAPKALIIVPWKGSELGNAQGISTMLDDSKLPIDKEVFMRMLSYYEIRSGTASPAGAPAGTNAAPPAGAAPRRKP